MNLTCASGYLAGSDGAPVYQCVTSTSDSGSWKLLSGSCKGKQQRFVADLWFRSFALSRLMFIPKMTISEVMVNELIRNGLIAIQILFVREYNFSY